MNYIYIILSLNKASIYNFFNNLFLSLGQVIRLNTDNKTF